MSREYDHLFKLLIIGDSGEYKAFEFLLWANECTTILCSTSGVGKSSLLLRFSDNMFSSEFTKLYNELHARMR